jgi:hypothetical protein
MDPRRDATARWEELASRTSNGLEVTLFGQRDRKSVNVRVVDARTEDAFELTVAA